MKNKTKGAAQKDGGAVNAEDPAAAAKQIEKLGAAKGGDKKGDQSATHLDYEGAGRMGYTQNFGPARKGGYAKGAAKVNSIMKGAAQNGNKPVGTTQDERSGYYSPQLDLNVVRANQMKAGGGNLDVREPAIPGRVRMSTWNPNKTPIIGYPNAEKKTGVVHEGFGFGDAFKIARTRGYQEFEHKGKKYHTRTKEEEAS
jgi:hypothetical protein